MTTTTQKFETYGTRFDATYGEWDVVDGKGEVVDSYEAKAEADAEAVRLSEEAEAEWLAGEIEEAVSRARDSGDLAGLRRFADFVGQIR